MNIIQSILLWIAVAILFIILCMTNVVGIIFGLVAIALIIPIKKWQDILVRFLKKPIKIIAICLSIILMFASVSSVPEEPKGDVSSSITSTVVQKDNELDISSVESFSSKDETLVEDDASSKEDTSSKSEVSSTNSETQQNTASSTESTSSTETHMHTFVAATCTSPEKCSCGITNGVALGHKYSNGSCTVCGSQDPNYTPPQTNTTTYVLNTESMKFHLLSCSWLPDYNREDTTKSREEIINEGYEPCKRCNP